MVLSERANAGHAGRLDSLPAIMDMNVLNVQGDGCLRIDEGCDPPRVRWDPSRHAGFSFLSQEDAKFEETVRSLEAFQAETVALSGRSSSADHASSPERPGGTSDSGPDEETQRTRTKYDAYMVRMKLLREEARHDGHALNLASEVDFRQFIQSAPRVRKGNLVLMDNGNLRAIWKDGQGARLGLQFLGGRMIQYVIFKRRTQGQQISRVTGRDTFEGLKRQIDAFELHSLLCE